MSQIFDSMNRTPTNIGSTSDPDSLLIGTSHVAQQSRRDKLRFGATHRTQGPNPIISPDLVQVRDVRNCDSSLYDDPTMPLPSSGLVDFTNESAFHQPDWIMNNNHPLFPSQVLELPSPQFYDQNSVIQELGTSHGLGMAAGSLVNSPCWLDQRQLMQFNGKIEGGLSSTQGLSLSLSSSNNPVELNLANLDHHAGFGYLSPKFSTGGGGRGNYGGTTSGSGSGPSTVDPRRTAGPLGPFTGYATILKSSKFLKPAQQLLDEFCSVVMGSKAAKRHEYDGHVGEMGNSVLGGSFGSCEGVVGDEGVSGGRGGSSRMSSGSFYSSTDGGGGGGGSSSAVGGESNCQMNRPEFQQQKVKLLYMQEEVCRRYKQYHQQMQMVVSSFESVAGLSAATPYASSALKAVSKHFRCLKNAISDQIRHVSRVLGEELTLSPSSSARGETTMTTTTTATRLKYIDQSLRKQKAASENSSLGFLDNNQPVWRPQRGLPERAVAVLRAWLFEHFLHPYPTDTDKHMLATQTGLSRNQVSNWFINARVRLWKPMVEEIHMLETNGMAGMDLNSSHKNAGRPIVDEQGQPCSDQRSGTECSKPLDCCPSMGLAGNLDTSSHGMEQWHREKRSRMEDCMVPGSLDGGFMSFAYEGGMDIGGLGAVSLTLGLRHNEDPAQQQQQHEMRHYGSQMLHDFVG